MGRGNGTTSTDGITAQRPLNRRSGTSAAPLAALATRRLASLSKERKSGRPMSPREKARYSHAIGYATGVRPGETLTIEIGDVEDTELAVEVAIDAYLRGARKVRILTGADKQLLVSNEIAAGLAGEASVDPNAIVVQDAASHEVWATHVDENAAHVQINSSDQTSLGEVWNHAADNSLRWSMVYWPSSRLAERVILDDNVAVSQRMLAEDLLYYSHASEQDNPNSWQQHIETLRERSAKLNGLGIDELEIETTTGTSLKVGLLDTSMFNLCDWETIEHRRFGCNFPTEEVFVTPDPTRLDGRFTSVAPCPIQLAKGGAVWAAAVGGTFKNGELQREGFWVEAEDPRADADEIAALAYEYLRANPGALQVGEVALVGSDSRIAERVRETGRFYGLNNLDENAGVHFALGESYVAGLTDMAEDVRRNRSAVHKDFTISHGTASVRAKLRDGGTVELMVNGEWQL